MGRLGRSRRKPPRLSYWSCRDLKLPFVFPFNKAVVIAALVCSMATAQEPAKTGVPTIANEALRAVVRVIVSDQAGKEVRQGSGVVISRDGRVLTNYHLIQGTASAYVKFADGSFYEVEGALGADAGKDLAVLKIRASGKQFPFLPLGDSEKTQVGESVVAVGSPLGLEATVSTGIISGVRNARDIDPRFPEGFRLLQTTAPISPGSSGGALLNVKGEVIGITTAELLPGQNLNFAVPINYAKLFMNNQSPQSLGQLEPQPQAVRGRVDCDRLDSVDLLADPRPSSVIAKLACGEQLTILGKEKGWYRVRTPEGREGYVSQWFVTEFTNERPVPANGRSTIAELQGTYLGVWQSPLNGSGALALTVVAEGEHLRAEVVVTGSPSGYRGDDLAVMRIREMGEHVWTVEFRAEHSKLSASGIFKPGTFVGDFTYSYSRLKRPDRGQWILKKQ